MTSGIIKWFKHKNLPIRILFVIILVIPFIFLGEFYTHFEYYLSGSIFKNIVQNDWKLVILNIAVFTAFLIPLSFRRKVKWSEYGLVGAFFISLFVEMYGIPLSILFASKYFTPTAT
ncbi:hypothetical protein ACFLZX_06665, partial [Nanoarchaeota archaeon]